MRAAALLALAVLSACASYRDRAVPMATQAIDPARYSGTWVEIAAFPVWFQQGCTATRATYAVTGPATLSVLNTCRDGAPDGPERSIKGTAQVVGPGQLSVRLGAVPFAAPYHVLWVDAAYETAAVGVPSGRAGWILARSPAPPAGSVAAAEAALRRAGYATGALVRTQH